MDDIMNTLGITFGTFGTPADVYEHEPLLPNARKSSLVNVDADKQSPSCCVRICHRDRVAELSMNQRFQYLVHGFVREQSAPWMIPGDVSALCERYAIDWKGFDRITLMTEREYLRYIEKDCCGRQTLFRRISSEYWLAIIDCVKMNPCLNGVVLLMIAKDIATLCIGAMNGCHEETVQSDCDIDGVCDRSSMMASVWIYSTSISDIFLMILSSALRACGIVGIEGAPTSIWFLCAYDVVQIICIGQGFGIFTATDDSLCSNMILSWCIVQSIMIGAGHIGLGYLFFCRHS